MIVYNIINANAVNNSILHILSINFNHRKPPHFLKIKILKNLSKTPNYQIYLIDIIIYNIIRIINSIYLNIYINNYYFAQK